MDVRLLIDDKEIVLNKFVKRIFSGIILGAIMSLKGMKEDWNKIRIEIAK